MARRKTSNRSKPRKRRAARRQRKLSERRDRAAQLESHGIPTKDTGGDIYDAHRRSRAINETSPMRTVHVEKDVQCVGEGTKQVPETWYVSILESTQFSAVS